MMFMNPAYIQIRQAPYYTSSESTTMDRCPAEIVLRFANFACTDGEEAGCSLSLVSHYVRGATAPLRYHSVAIIGQDNLLSFATLVRDGRIPVVIQHVFISIWMQVPREKLKALEEALATVLARAAPSVQTLVVHDARRAKNIIANLGTSFPVLKDFSLPSENSLKTFDSATFPALRRFHACTLLNLRGFRLWEATALSFPSLTHLRITRISQDRVLPPLLRMLLQITVPGEREFLPGSQEGAKVQRIADALSQLKDVIVQPRHFESDGYCGTGALLDGEMQMGLESIARASKRAVGEGRLFLQPDSKEHTLEAAITDWLDLVAGGDGPWSVHVTDGR